MKKLCYITLLFLVYSACTKDQKNDKKNTESSIPLYTALTINNDLKVLNSKFNKSDISSLQLSELRILRNYYYALHGYKFKSAELRKYYSQYKWYNPEPGKKIIFNDTEKHNINLIIAREMEKKCVYYAINTPAYRLEEVELNFETNIAEADGDKYTIRKEWSEHGWIIKLDDIDSERYLKHVLFLTFNHEHLYYCELFSYTEANRIEKMYKFRAARRKIL